MAKKKSPKKSGKTTSKRTSQSKASTPKVRAFSVDRIVEPAPGIPVVLDSQGRFRCSGVFTDINNQDQIWAQCKPVLDPFDDPSVSTDGFTPMTLDAAANTFEGLVPAVVCDTDGGTDNNAKVGCWFRRDAGGVVVWFPVVSVVFPAHCESLSETVNAHDCLWFTYASSGFKGPYDENDDDRPTTVTIPGYAKRARIVTTLGAWTNHKPGGHLVGAAGNASAGARPTRPAYSSAAYNSTGIGNVSAYLCELVGLLEFGTGPTGQIVRIGADQTLSLYEDPTDPTTNKAVKLHLGFHDGYQWSNNKGNVFPTIHWLPDHP